MDRGDARKRTGLTDPFRRRIDYLRVSVTDRCNLKCIYCMPEKGVRPFGPAELLTLDEIVRIVQAAHLSGVRKVRITGGEPLLRPDIISLISTIKQWVAIRDLSLTTNGMLLSGMAAGLKAAGLDRVNISLDTLDAERFRTITRGGDISRVLGAIRAAAEAGLSPVKINVVVMRGINEDEIAKFARLTFDNDIHVRFIEYMPAPGTGWSRERSVPSGEIRTRIAELGALSPVEFRGRGPSRNYRLPGARGVIGFISPVSDHFCGYCNRLRLTATGTLRPCLFSAAGIDIRSLLRSGAGDEEVASLFAQAVALKPRGHSLKTYRDSDHTLAMAQIGG